MKYTFLTEKFYNDYPHEQYPQMEIKEDRPYAHVQVEAYHQLFCIPLRSHIDHPHALFTNKKERCGVDYSKAVVINNEDYIDKTKKAFLRPDETVDHRKEILAFSTLQYFEEYIYNDNKNCNG